MTSASAARQAPAAPPGPEIEDGGAPAPAARALADTVRAAPEALDGPAATLPALRGPEAERALNPWGDVTADSAY
ncbi:hypothetical protein [Streptomyces sp. WAC06614]|uniref:hypothetical protein n=1 Tax=Streptomyces sp. WAC06614 TaxID=2487416 RepID=UPI0021AEC3F5|nr:hypothetical protein [Streptomyces sp. WAC06614]